MKVNNSSMLKSKIGIVIVNYNGNTDTLDCLTSIEKFYSKHHNLKIFLIDNNSIKPIEDSIINEFKLNIHYIKSNENLGFTGGNNIGIRKAIEHKCEYIALLNNDTELIDNSLDRALLFLDNNLNYGIIGLINYYHSNQNLIWQAGFKSNLFLGYSKKINIKSHHDVVVPVDYVPGSSIIISKKVIDKIGFLDDDYFAYFEEYDYCIRAKKKNFKTGYLIDSKILHKVGKSSSNPVKMYLRTRNKFMFYNKNGIKSAFFIAATIHIIVSLLRIIKSNNSIKLMHAFLLGIKDYNIKNYNKGSLNKLT